MIEGVKIEYLKLKIMEQKIDTRSFVFCSERLTNECEIIFYKNNINNKVCKACRKEQLKKSIQENSAPRKVRKITKYRVDTKVTNLVVDFN